MPTRRDFLTSTANASLGTALLGIATAQGQESGKQTATIPAVIATWVFGRKGTVAAGKVLTEGGNSLDAVEKGINVVELDPEIDSVGYGGLPNAEGIVELDAMIMHGPAHRAGAVASVRDIATPISVARKLMEEPRPTLLVGPGARTFAVQKGFQPQDLLTPHAKKKWEDWLHKQKESPKSHDTIGMVAVDAKGDITVGCSTSGLPFKRPGRVGDSPIIGAGAYCDNDVGGAAATGNGDVMLRYCLTFMAVEFMRQGASPQKACEGALHRIVAKNQITDASVVALNKRGEFGAAKIGRPDFPHAVWNLKTEELRSIKQSAT
jgi:L-asparaginase/N4-(beta-N-acetylglucosaminyl)-L-asparaginase